MDTAPQRRLIQSYGRRRGRPLRSGRAALIQDLLPALAIPPPAAGEVLDPRRLFVRPMDAVWLEVGFGAGEHLAAQAEAHRSTGFIGAETYINGIAGLLARVREVRLDNLRLWPADIRLLLPAFPPRSIARAFVLFPDPWPKARHHKRRLVAAPFLDELGRVMAPGAELRVATDDEDYAAWVREQLAAHHGFVPVPGAHLRRRPADWIPTRYEMKALEQGRTPHYFCVVCAP
ncbi:MAG TPA: tRNA (guanine(46)-N(7))-methyltransferase TrmB [Alphaproteobacteria bacterium]|nr:tRNA (guanine(46)-N(7))-methyltransferase TrmB [Alphaproteobacteria bacterium]